MAYLLDANVLIAAKKALCSGPCHQPPSNPE